jgi:hypothetical protein
MSNNKQREDAKKRNELEGERLNLGDGKKATINPTSDPKYPSGSTYVTITNKNGKKDDATMVVDKNGNILNKVKK